MKLYYEDTLIAYMVDKESMPYMRLVDDIDKVPIEHIPVGLFWNPNDLSKLKKEITGFEFADWLACRTFPRERYDCKDLLKELNLERYMPVYIISQTQGVLLGVDKFWIDFEDGRGKPDI